MRRNRRTVGSAALIVSLVTCLSACSSTPSTWVELDAALLTPADAGGGEQTALESDVRASVASCGPDLELYYYGRSDSDTEYRKDVVRFANDHESRVLALWDVSTTKNQGVAESMRRQYARGCADDVKSPPASNGELSQDWHIKPFEGFGGKDVFAFEAVSWYFKHSMPPEGLLLPTAPVASEHIEVTSTARAYGQICDTVVMVRINNTTATPPTEAALKELWDKQVNKLIQVRYPNYPDDC